MVRTALACAVAVPAVAAHAANAQPNCQVDFVKQAFAGDTLTEVLSVRAYSKGDTLQTQPVVLNATADLCAVKLRVGPGSPGAAGDPSTQAGIGIEIWLPTGADWDGRIHALGGGGFVGVTQITSLTEISAGTSNAEPPAVIAGREHSVTAATDTGHVSTPVEGRPNRNGSFLMLPDGSPNLAQWQDYSERGIHEMSVKTKRLTAQYYDTPARHAYFEGCSTGGRQAHKYAQRFPDDYDGIVAGASAINFTRFSVGAMYPQIVMQRELGRVIEQDKLALVSSAAVSACDSQLTGKHEGFISDPAACQYDPTQDKSVLCTTHGGSNTGASCLSRQEAAAINKFWYGPTVDGSVPSPAKANGFSATLAPDQLWFGPTRGTVLMMADSHNGKAKPISISAHITALIAGDGKLAPPTFVNRHANGADGWKSLGYADLVRLNKQGIARQGEFSQINTDDPDLSRFAERGGKIIAFHGLNDPLIPPQGTYNYYQRLAENMGGIAKLDEFYRFFPVPAMGHCGSVGSAPGLPGVSPEADPPLPRHGQFYKALTQWVEEDAAPQTLTLSNRQKNLERPLCKYPSKLHFKGGDTDKVTSYDCI